MDYLIKGKLFEESTIEGAIHLTVLSDTTDQLFETLTVMGLLQFDPDLKLHGLNEKYLLKKMMKGRLPDPILNRPKQAYRAPIQSVFMAESAREQLEFASEKALDASGIFNRDHVEGLLKKLKASDRVSEVDNMALTAVLSTQMLNDLFVDRSIGRIPENERIRFDKTVLENKVITT